MLLSCGFAGSQCAYIAFRSGGFEVLGFAFCLFPVIYLMLGTCWKHWSFEPHDRWMRATLYADFELLIFASLGLNVVASPLTMGISQSNEFMYPRLLGFAKHGGLLTNLTLTLNSLIKLRGNEPYFLLKRFNEFWMLKHWQYILPSLFHSLFELHVEDADPSWAVFTLCRVYRESKSDKTWIRDIPVAITGLYWDL